MIKLQQPQKFDKQTAKNQVKSGQNYSSNNGSKNQNLSNPNQQNQQPFKPIPTFTIDIRDKKKIEDFKEERKFKIFERIAPYLEREDQKKDLKWSIDGIKKLYEGKLEIQKKEHEDEINQHKKNLKNSLTEAKKKEIWEQYFKKHHKVNSEQVCKIFKLVRNMSMRYDIQSIDTNMELQQKSLMKINQILANEDVDEEEMIPQMMVPNIHQHHGGYINKSNSDITSATFESLSNIQDPMLSSHNSLAKPVYGMNYMENLMMQQPMMQMPNQSMVYNNYGQSQHYAQFPGQYDSYYNNYMSLEKFSKDLEKFYHELSDLRESYKEPRSIIVQLVNNIIDEIDIIKYSEIYGSYKTELDLPSSDIDFVITNVSQGSLISTTHADGSEWLKQLNDKLLTTNYEWIEKINYISSASIPIIKIDTKMDNCAIKVDISFKHEGHKGNDWVQIVKSWIEKYPVLRDITMVLKHILKVYNVNDPYTGGLSSYALILMIVAYIQYSELMKNSPIDFYNPNLSSFDIARIIHDLSKFYTETFDLWKIIIQPKLDTIIDPYNMTYPIVNKFGFNTDSPLNIIDPLNSENNVWKSSFNVDQIKNCLQDINSYILMSLDETKQAEYQKWITDSLTFEYNDMS